MILKHLKCVAFGAHLVHFWPKSKTTGDKAGRGCVRPVINVNEARFLTRVLSRGCQGWR